GLGVTLLASLVVVLATEGLTPRTHSLPAAAPLALNILAFAAFTSLVIALTNRTLFSIALVTSIYEALVLCNRLKIAYLSTPIHPADLLVVSNVLYVALFSPRALAAGVAAVLAVVVGLVILFRVRSFRVTVVGRASVAFFSLALLAGLMMAYRSSDAREFLQARGVASYTPDPSIEVEYNGLLLNLLLHASDLIVPVPVGYDEAMVERIVGTLSNHSPPTPVAAEIKRVNLVMFVVEAMMDPDDLGWRFTSDPMPFFHGLRQRFSSGWAYSPELGG